MITTLPAKKLAKEIRECLSSNLDQVYVRWLPYAPVRVCNVRIRRGELQVRCAPGQALMWAPVARKIVTVSTYTGYRQEAIYSVE